MEEFEDRRRENWLRGNVTTHSATCIKGVEWRFGWIGLRMLAVCWAGIPVEVTQEAA